MKRLVTAFVLASIAFAADVNTDYDKKADFTQYRTYSWIGVNASNSLWSDRIRNDVDQQLAAKGWSKVQSGGDAAVSAFGATKTEQRLNTFYDTFPGWYWSGFGPTATTTVENVPVGTLIVDLFDARSKKLVWRGRATSTLSEKPEKNERKLEDAVEDMFKKFPPKSKD